MESFYEIIQQIKPWTWVIIIIGVVSTVLAYRKRKRSIRESDQYTKEYYDCFDDDGNYIEGKMEEFTKKQKEKYKKYNNYSDDRPDKGGYF